MKKSFYSYSAFLERLNENKNEFVISPDFTPHEEFHKYRWLVPNGGKWYYKLKDLKPCVVPKNPSFGDSVDSELKSLVSFLHKKGIPTTPSCSGHFYSPDEWSESYDQLSKDSESIQGQGLKLKDPEDGKIYTLKDPGYRLPWNKDSFVERAKEHSKFGVLGIYDPGNFFAKRISSNKIANCQLKKDGTLTLVLTSPRNSKELKECWNKITECVIKNPLS